VQSLIREVAYGTMARRDRRSRHLAAARHYEVIGEDELAGALASHYVAAHQASDAGDESDAIAVQARLALGAAAGRAASLGSHDQAIAYLEQALDITTDAADRAPLLDRAAISAVAAAREDAPRYGQTAVEAYREVGDRVAVATATARLGRVFLDASELDRAREVLEPAVTDAEALDDKSPLAAILANLARVYMRRADMDRSIAAADRALALAERLNLEPVIAEALENKASALNMAGRRRESSALHAKALELAQKIGERSLELRIWNNYASGTADDDPVASARMLVESAALARDLGDRGIYYFQLTQVAAAHLEMGRDWDEYLVAMKDAYETSALRNDRIRLRIFIGLMEAARGERLDAFHREIEELADGQAGVEARFALSMVRAEVELRRGAHDAAYQRAIEACDLLYQDPSIAAEVALRAAMRGQNPDGIRRAAGLVAELQRSGLMTEVRRQQARAALAASDGRTDAAVADFTAVQVRLASLEQAYLAALMAIDAVALLPDAAPLRELAERSRPLLEDLRASADIADLDRALASGRPSTAARSAAEIPSTTAG